jgi:hypothetical protein
LGQLNGMSDERKKTRWQVFVATVPAIFVAYAIIVVVGQNAPPSLLLFIMLPAAAVTWFVCLGFLDRRWP